MDVFSPLGIGNAENGEHTNTEAIDPARNVPGTRTVGTRKMPKNRKQIPEAGRCAEFNGMEHRSKA